MLVGCRALRISSQKIISKAILIEKPHERIVSLRKTSREERTTLTWGLGLEIETPILSFLILELLLAFLVSRMPKFSPGRTWGFGLRGGGSCESVNFRRFLEKSQNYTPQNHQKIQLLKFFAPAASYFFLRWIKEGNSAPAPLFLYLLLKIIKNPTFGIICFLGATIHVLHSI